jgi:ribose transport system permease protein
VTTCGVVSVAGTILAAALVRTIQLGRVQLQIDARWVDVVIGVVVLLAVLVGRARDRAENGR